MSLLDALQFTASNAGWLPAADAIVKATILLGAAGLASAALRHASAATRHLLWTLALLSALALPAMSIALPRWQLPLVTLAPADSTAAIESAEPLAAVPAPARDFTRSSGPTGYGTRTAAAAAPTRDTWPNISWTTALLLLWLAGAAAILARIAIGVAAVKWISRRTERADDAPWLPLARRLAAELGITPRILFLRSASATMPMAWGVLRPAVVMPAEADAWPAERLRIVLLHELAHVKRRDCLTHILAQAACACYWFNPLAWVAARNLRMERERACDDLVLASGTRGPDYADQLLEVARVMRATRFPGVLAGASLAMAHRSQLEGRLMAILDPTVPRAGLTRLRTAAASATFALALVPLASLQPWAFAGEPAAPDQQVSGIPGTPDDVQGAKPAPRPNPKPAPTPAPAPTPDEVGALAGDVVRETVPAAVQAGIDGALRGLIEGSIRGAVEGVFGSSPEVQEAIAEAQASGKTADPKLIAALTAALKDSDKEVRETAMHALVRMRHPAIFEPLVAALSDASPDVREQAAFGLGQMRDRRAIGPLTGALKDTNASVREQVVFALGQMRDPASVDGLAAALRDSNADVREQAAFALGQIRDRRAVEPLISMLKDSAPDVREQAAFALGQIRDRAAVEALVVALKDGNADVREQAAFALGQIRDERAIDGLTEALKDASADVRQQAAFALGQLAR